MDPEDKVFSTNTGEEIDRGYSKADCEAMADLEALRYESAMLGRQL